MACGPAAAAVYHVDPATGSMSNPGTATQPWSTLEAVFGANRTFAAGDEIVLHDGYHGVPVVKGNNSGDVVIRPFEGANPRIRNLVVRNASSWVIRGIDICPEHAGSGTVVEGTLLEIEASGSRISVEDCTIRSALDIAGWTAADWYATAADRGIRTAGPFTTLSGNRILYTGFGITVRKTAPNSVVKRNLIQAFYQDGIGAFADDCVFEYNTVTDSYVDDANHDDFFQSWSTNSAGTVGAGVIRGVVVRGNTFISRSDPAQPLATEPQGIGCFDGMYEGWVIENNLIVTNTYHGISLYGATACKVVNNTVVENPFDIATGKKPWIQIYAHKNDASGNPWPVSSSGNLIRNNVSADTARMVSGGGIIDHNVKTNAYGTWFTDPAGFNFNLKPGAPGIGAGHADEAPLIDIREQPRSIPVDLGAYEHGSPYQEWLVANGLPPDGSGDGAPEEDPIGDGVGNGMKFALGLPVTTRGYGGRVATGIHTTGGQRYLSLTFIHPDPAPSGVTYQVQTAPGLSAWSGTSTVVVSDAVSGGLRTREVRDAVPIGAGSARRFIRLAVDLP